MFRFSFCSALLAMLFAMTPLVAQTNPTRAMVDVRAQLAPWQTYYNSRSEWPKHWGYKPFKRFEADVLQRSFPNGQIPAGAIWEAYRQRVHTPRTHLDDNWRNLGPYNHGGRARVIRWLPGNPNVMFVGSVSGGVFKSTDAGESWLPITDDLPNLAVGCFEIDPNNPQVMYLGTGEGYYNIDGVGGIGLLKSTDGGVTWAQTGLSYLYSQGESIYRINIDPRNSQLIFAATRSGLRRSTDGGQSFAVVRSGEIKDVARDPSNPDVMLCAGGYPWGTSTNGIYRSINAGQSWTAVNSGLPSIDQIGRIVLAFAPSNSQIAYAGICGTFAFNNAQMIGMYRSTDNGQTWTRMSADGENHYASQGWYDMALAVSPTDPNKIFSSGLDSHRSTDGGATWALISRWDFAFGNPLYVHADHHEARFHPTHPNELWEVTDGGIFKSVDNGATWTEKNNGFVTLQYYAMGNATQDTLTTYGGTQDNGTFQYDGSPDFNEVYGGDGGYTVVDYVRDSTVYVETQNGGRVRTDNRCASFSRIGTGISGTGYWVTPMLLDPFNHLILYTTTSDGKFWKSTNQGRNNTWSQLGQTLSGSMQVIGASALVQGRLYVGSESLVARYDLSAGQWQIVSGNLPNAWITRLTPSPFDANTVYATVSGFGHGHVFKSVQAGNVWVDISGNLPDVPFQDIICDPREPAVLYAGGDIGVYQSTNGGATWAVFGDGLPAVRIDDMELQSLSGVLRAASHGRGLWEIHAASVAFALISPQGGELYAPGDPVEFLWSGTTYGGNVRIEINRNYPSAVWDTIAVSTPNDGSTRWTATGPESEHVRFRITHLPGGPSDTSNADTRIVQPRVQLFYPNGGETLLSGVRDTVYFSRLLVPELLRLSINRDYPSGTWETIASDVYGDTSTFWAVQLPATVHARLRIESAENAAIFDESDADFTIRAPHMSLQSPIGGEQIPAGQVFLIQWSAPEHHANVRVLLNRDYPSGTWQNLTLNTANDGIYEWTPQPPEALHCRIRVAAMFDPSTYVESPADFQITASGVSNRNVPTQFALSDPHPNPFNPSTQITLDLPKFAHVEARAFNRLGQEAAVLMNDNCSAGRYVLTFDGRNLPSGLYFIRIFIGSDSRIVKAVLMK